ncbi:MAG: hypothetical protein Alpg2KO_31730 [Alphaproteobacteria bacterium]
MTTQEVSKKIGKLAKDAAAEVTAGGDEPVKTVPVSKRPDKELSFEEFKREQAVEMLGAAHVDSIPTFLKDGLMRAGIGWYRMAEHPDGRRALLFSYNRRDLEGEALEGKDGVYPRNYSNIHVVEARSKRSRRPWVYAAITQHQQTISDSVIDKATLYQTDKDTFQSGAVAYKLFEQKDENDEPIRNEDGDKLYSLRFYSEAKSDEAFTRVEEEAPSGLFSRVFSLGEEKGSFTRKEAETFISQDFNRRAERLAKGEDPLTPEEKTENVRWYGIRSWQQFKHWMGNHSPIGLAAKAASRVLTAPDGAFAFAKNIGNKVAKKVIEKDALAKSGTDIADDLVRDDWKNGHAFLSVANGSKLRNFRLLNEKEAGVRPFNVRAHDCLGRDWAKQWIFEALQGAYGSVVRMRENGVINIEKNDGIVLDIIPEKKLAYARFRERAVQPNGHPIPDEVAELLKSGRVLRLHMHEGGIASKFLSKADFHKELSRAAGRKADAEEGLGAEEHEEVTGRKKAEAPLKADRRRPVQQGTDWWDDMAAIEHGDAPEAAHAAKKAREADMEKDQQGPAPTL